MRRVALAFLLIAALGAIVLAGAMHRSLSVTTRTRSPGDLIDAHLVTTLDCGEWVLRSYDSPALSIVRASRSRPSEIALFADSEWIFLGARFVDGGRLIAFTRSFDGAVTPYSSADCG